MKDELLKRKPLLDNIFDRMTRTFDDRRKKVAEGIPVMQILKEYPALTRAEVVCWHDGYVNQ